MDARTSDICEADGVRVERAEAFRLEIPLTSPYENALGALRSFDAVVFRMTGADGAEGWGEACPVTGYSPETPAEAWDFARQILPDLTGRTHGEVGSILEEQLGRYPFVVSALNEALADMRGEFGSSAPEDGPEAVELIGTINTLDPLRAPDLAQALLAKGYRTLKVKVGYDPAADACRVRRIAEAVEDRAVLRIDANQGYTVTQALAFARAIPAEVVEVFEQPVPADDWEGIRQVAAASPVPIMLDESIYGDADVERAARIGGVAALKLKMSKSGGPGHLARQVARCRELGLEVVIGNDVATDLGCLHEGRQYLRLGLSAAGEMNGFLKPVHGILSTTLEQRGASLFIPSSVVTSVDAERLADFTKETVSAG